jgi:hypothetical protein
LTIAFFVPRIGLVQSVAVWQSCLRKAMSGGELLRNYQF